VIVRTHAKEIGEGALGVNDSGWGEQYVSTADRCGGAKAARGEAHAQ
jgi:hypothetical protein